MMERFHPFSFCKRLITGEEEDMEFFIGWDAIKLMERPRGASLDEIADSLSISRRYAQEVLNNISCVKEIYEKRGDYLYPRRKRFYLNSFDEFGSPLRVRGELE